MCAGRRLGGGMGTLPSWRATCPIPARRLPPRASVPGNKLLDVGPRTGSRDRGSVRSAGAASAGHEAWDATGRPVLRGKPTRGAVSAGCGCGRAACPTLAPAGRCCSRQFFSTAYNQMQRQRHCCCAATAASRLGRRRQCRTLTLHQPQARPLCLTGCRRRQRNRKARASQRLCHHARCACVQRGLARQHA